MLFLSKVSENTFCVKDQGLKVAKAWPWVLPHCAQQSVSLSDVMNNTKMWQKYWMCHEPIFFSFTGKFWANQHACAMRSSRWKWKSTSSVQFYVDRTTEYSLQANLHLCFGSPISFTQNDVLLWMLCDNCTCSAQKYILICNTFLSYHAD